MAWARRDLVAALCAGVALGGCDRPEGKPAPAISASPGTATALAVTRAVITVDALHDMMSTKDAAPYSITPSTELVIELGDHRFAAQRDGGPQTPGVPDTVHVQHGSSGYHRASFSGRRVTLNAASLDAVKGGPFAGFEAGENYVVAVGVEAPSPKDGAMRFTPLWMGKVNVAAK
jgi:hypothetical protein